MNAPLLPRLTPAEVALLPSHGTGSHAGTALDRSIVPEAARIVAEVESGGEAALRSHAERLGDIEPGAPLIFDRSALEAALAALDADDRGVLERTASRIRAFAAKQRGSLAEFEIGIEAGLAGQEAVPVERAGCYAPGGRYPLPSSVLMTAITARTAGVEEVWVASPRPAAVTLAAAAIAGARALLAAGGAHAVAALACGAGAVPRCDIVVGPGNRWVTAAKYLVSDRVGIDSLAGPSELVLVADAGSDPELIAADLLAQAEHAPDARPILIALEPSLVEAVEGALHRRLADLPARETARAALGNGFAVVAGDREQAAGLCDCLAPEHLELHLADPDGFAGRVRHYGALFIGPGAAEVFGDYGAGPNHVLPTGGTARWSGGLSVFTFLRVRTWYRSGPVPPPAGFRRDVERLARLEGLEAHARSAGLRDTAVT